MLLFFVVWTCLVFFFCKGITPNVSEEISSQNVSVGQMVEFACVTANGTDLITWNLVPHIESTTTKIENLPGGGKQSLLNFTALQGFNNTIVKCVITDPSTLTVTVSNSRLLIQGLLPDVGTLTSIVMDDNCSLYFNWTAPYTLQGVPINYYTINITRHSDGAVLRSDTTNTTEYLYNVTILGETLEIVVAAVNDVGTGNTSSTVEVTSVSVGNLALLSTNCVLRNRSIWRYNFYNLESLSCSEAIDKVIVEACPHDSSECVNISAVIADDGRRVVATFSNLIENRKYTTVVHVLYNGGVEQQSQPVEINTFDIQNASIAMLTTNKICLIVGYIEGHETPLYAFSRLSCLTTQYVQNIIIEGTEGCINTENINSSQNCSLSVTDVDALDIVDTTPAIVITEILITRNITSNNLKSTTSRSSIQIALNLLPTSTLVLTTCNNSSTIPIEECQIALCIGIPTAVAIIVLVITMLISTFICCSVIIKNRKDSDKNLHNNNYEEVAKKNVAAPPVLYEKIDYMTQTAAVKSSQKLSTSSAPLPPPRPQDNMSMEECQAYGVNTTINPTALSSPLQQLSNIEMEECQAYGTSFQLLSNIEMEQCKAYDTATRK